MSDTETQCETCEREDLLTFCTGCNEYYCVPCWERKRAHRENRLGPGGIPHEQVDPAVVKSVKGCMEEPKDEKDEQEQHEDDQDTTWFGLNRDTHGDFVLEEYRRYATIMMETAPAENPPIRYPSLVSFMGQTGAGKSTLIRLLIDPVRNLDSTNSGAQLTAPIIGRSDCEVPTSADVHLYADPNSFSTTQPVLFADCEGFEGGERDPIATASGARAAKKEIPRRPLRTVTGRALRIAEKVSRPLSSATRHTLAWARRDSLNYEHTSKRQYAVTKLYPRIFYAFSDVIVFVMNNPKTLEGVIEQLLEWADANYSKSVNLPCKPHAIIALNKCPNTTADKLWDHLTSTANLFKAMNAQIHKNQTFQQYVKKWQTPRDPIADLEDLFKCYYSSVHVIRFPDKSRYHLLDQQRKELYNIIGECREKSFSRKKTTEMLPDVDQFGLYMSLAFKHFSETLDEPFDYVKASMKYQLPPATMAQSLYVFVKLTAEKMGKEGNIEAVFTNLVDIVASCFLLDSVRRRRFGQPEDWFRADLSRMQTGAASVDEDSWSSYELLCRRVIQRYYESDVTCEVTESGHRCQLHKKNHYQTHRIRGRWMTYDCPGPFWHSYQEHKFRWEQRVLDRITQLHTRPEWNNFHDLKTAHTYTLRPFYDGLMTGNGIFCNSVCLCCLFNPPQYQLTCGHIICLDCAKDFSRHQPGDKTRITIEECPIHGNISEISSPTTIALDPPYSGLRVLTLDGGGVRGIVELAMLKAIESRISVPLHHFFDLVVGTSTGGICSLAFGHELWSVDECNKKFIELVKQAFKLRQGQGVQGIKQLQLVIKGSKYETKPLQDALQKAFGEGNLFDVQHKNEQARLRVAVTAVSDAGQKPWLLSNYNARSAPTTSDRQPGKQDGYMRWRPDRPEGEFKVWEAARGTAAAPGFFRFFAKAATPNQIFPDLLDGALRHNNPISIAKEEVCRIAETNNLQSIPDILVSLGTGLSKTDHRGFPTQPQDNASFEDDSDGRRRKVPFYRNIPLFAIVRFQVKLNLDSEARWRNVTEPLQGPSSPWKDRLFRFNPDLGEEPPELDDVAKVDAMANNVAGWTNRPEVRDHINIVTCSLVASSFYFEKTGKAVTVPHSSKIELQGRIQCRIRDHRALMDLGRFLSSGISAATFVIDGSHNKSTAAEERIAVPVGDMVERGVWGDVEVVITIPSEETKTGVSLDLLGIAERRRRFNISGFPRQLMRHDFKLSQGAPSEK